jgi:hypothetical protein
LWLRDNASLIGLIGPLEFPYFLFLLSNGREMHFLSFFILYTRRGMHPPADR